MSLSGLKDIDREILKYVNDEELLKVCSLDKKTWKETCDDNFLKRRVSKYLEIAKYKFEKESWKKFFARFIYYRSELLKRNFIYTSGDFAKKYDSIRNYRKESLFILAAEDGDLELVKYAVIKENANIHTSNGYALRFASQQGYYDICKWLIDQGVDIHADNEASLNSACNAGHLEIVKLLVAAGADLHIDHDFALRSAADGRHFDIVKYLVEKGANVQASDNLALTVACKRNHFEMVKYLIQVGAIPTNRALTYAFSLENPEIYDYLMQIEIFYFLC